MAFKFGTGIIFEVANAKMGDRNGTPWQMIMIKPEGQYGFPARSKFVIWNNDPTPMNPGDKIMIDPTKEWSVDYRNKQFDAQDGTKAWYFEVSLNATVVLSSKISSPTAGGGISVSTDGWSDFGDDGTLPF